MYRRIVKQVISPSDSDTAKAIKLAQYVQNAMFVPDNARPVDDTAWDRLVAGEGFCDQEAWALATLLAKEDVPARLVMLRGQFKDSPHSVADVYLDGDWRKIGLLYRLTFRNPDGSICTREQLAKNPVLFESSSYYRAMLKFRPDEAKRIRGMFVGEYPAMVWAPLTEAKDGPRKFISRGLDAYVRCLGDRFWMGFQDAYLARVTRGMPYHEAEWVRARHRELAGRQEAARRGYLALIRDPSTPDLIRADALYFLGLNFHLQDEDRPAWENWQFLLKEYPHVRWKDRVIARLGVLAERRGDLKTAKKLYQQGKQNPLLRSGERLLRLASR